MMFGQESCSMLNTFGTNKSGRRFSHNLTYAQSRSSEDKAGMFSTNRRVASDDNIGIASPQVRGRTESAEAEGICLGSGVRKSSSLAAPKAGVVLLRVRPLLAGAIRVPLALRLDIGYSKCRPRRQNPCLSESIPRYKQCYSWWRGRQRGDSSARSVRTCSPYLILTIKPNNYRAHITRTAFF